MTPEARSRIQAAVEHSPEHRRVTLRRDDVRDHLAELDRLKAGAARAEGMLAEDHRLLAEQARELDYLRSTNEEMAATISDLVDERDDMKVKLANATKELHDLTVDRNRYRSWWNESRSATGIARPQRYAAEAQLQRCPTAIELWSAIAALPVFAFGGWVGCFVYYMPHG